MKIESITIKNFRGYKEEIKINISDLTLIVGKNDIGKSTILEAADIFFGNSKVDADDLNINCDKDTDKIEISIEFSRFPEEIDIDAGATTSLADEFLLNSNSRLEIKKVFTAGSKAQPKIFINANTPKNMAPLIGLKNPDLKNRAGELEIDESTYSASINNSIRKAIWSSHNISDLEETMIEVNKEDGKKIYEKLEAEFPIFTLFSVDRKNTDQDDEIQAPIKASVRELLVGLQDKLEPIRDEVLSKLDEISEGTIKKLEEMNPEAAKSLRSVADKPAWEKAFTINIESDGVPLNKRGSGVKRLVLINFFRQEAERKRTQANKIDVFYAIEEPETSQHPDWQIKLFDAFRELTDEKGVQIAITSHHPELCGLVKLDNIRFVKKGDNEKITIKEGDESNYKEISNTLGVLPKLDGVKVVVGVEGPSDVEFFKNISQVFDVDGHDQRILWIPMGGGTLRDYVDKGYLDLLNLPQVHFFDKDADEQYIKQVEKLKTKDNCWAKLTQLITIESYIHPKYYKYVWPKLKGDFVDLNSEVWLSSWGSRHLLNELSSFIKEEYENGNSQLVNYGKSKIKKSFAEIASIKMTKEDFDKMGTYSELKEFFKAIKLGYED